jgi:hypothetical protein
MTRRPRIVAAPRKPRGVNERKRNRQVRLSQTVVPFGVGNIYDFLGESLVACDTFWWQHHGEELHAPRLAKALRVRGFRSAPVQPDFFSWTRGPGVPYFRFPTWLFCQSCRKMTQWRKWMEEDGEPARCRACAKNGQLGPQLVPMRFVVACENGHLGDVPWHRWAHLDAKDESQRRCELPKLRFETVAGRGSGLDTLAVWCETCDARNTLQGIASPNSLRRLKFKCFGKQPWEAASEARDCSATPQVLQRGASNLYYGIPASAIDIPPHSDYGNFSDITLKITTRPLFRAILDMPNLPLRESLMEVLAGEVGCGLEEVRMVLRREQEQLPGAGATSVKDGVDLETDEWHAFIHPQENQDERNHFITRHTQLIPNGSEPTLPKAALTLDALVNKVVLAIRLREVKALVSFSRLLPEKTKVSPGLDHDIEWLPAVEVFGEGIFVSFNEDKIRAWEKQPAIIQAAGEIEARRVASLIGPRLKEATPRFLLLHTLSHLLIRQLTFQCGYSSSSLKERIYAKSTDESDPQAGILIYTAAGDVEGTLGGLARQGEAPRLCNTILAALERGAWCSLDPICRESKAQGFQGLNRGACHACSLVAETSCDSANALLDRSFLVGGLGGIPGFFEEVIRQATEDSLRTRGRS